MNSKEIKAKFPSYSWLVDDKVSHKDWSIMRDYANEVIESLEQCEMEMRDLEEGNRILQENTVMIDEYKKQESELQSPEWFMQLNERAVSAAFG